VASALFDAAYATSCLGARHFLTLHCYIVVTGS
jgi:hypothetical protein